LINSAGSGFGFIGPDDGSPDVLIAIRALRFARLENHPAIDRKGTRVSYMPSENPRKPGRYVARSIVLEE
jgi:cold shock CspA family protein